MGGTRALWAPLLATPMIVTSILFVILRFYVFFACLPLCVCQRDTNCSSLYDRAMYLCDIIGKS